MAKDDTKRRLEKYIGLTREALSVIEIAVPDNTHLYTSAKDFIDMARRYLADAEHFREKKEFAKALSTVSYAHAWLDAGARLGLFNVGHDSRLFTVD